MNEASAASAPKTIQIKHWDGRVLYECEIPKGIESGMALRHALEKAVSERRDLRDADLSGADLRDADLSGADLSGADLSDAVLSGADLSGADLSGADLSDAVLSDADLSGADLSGADLSGAVLSEQKNDLWEILLHAPNEIAGLRAALVEGRVDGSTYEGACACLVGTIANLRGAVADTMEGINPDSSRPAEQWFMGIRKGDTPETNQISAVTVQWLDEFAALLAVAKGEPAKVEA